LLSKGSRLQFNRLWALQVSWMREQAESLRGEMNVNGPKDYAWRYMLGKMEVLEDLGFLLGFPASSAITSKTNSLRFTTPSWDAFMQ